MGITENLIWMCDINARFDEHVKELYKREPFWRLCSTCPDGHCCSKVIFPVLNRKGNPFLAEDWWMMLEYARDHFSAADRGQLYQNIVSSRSSCIFLFGNRCRIHPSRPLACRFYPYSISFHINHDRYPVGEIALPSCPTYASKFGIQTDTMYVQKPPIMCRDDQNHNLIKVKLKKRKPLWVLDASEFVKEYDYQLNNREKIMPPWDELLELAAETGGAECSILPYYVDKVIFPSQP